MTSSIARVLGFIKEILVAAVFGLSGALDIYLVAFVLIGFPLSILLNAVQTALISALAATRSSADKRPNLFAATALPTLACLAALLPLWLLLLPSLLPWLASGFSAEKRQELETALLWLTPYYFLNGLNLLSYGVLQAGGRFLINGLLPAVTPVITILILLTASAGGDWRTLAIALVVGTALECLVLLVILRGDNQLALPRGSEVFDPKPVIVGSLMLLPGTLMTAVGPVVEQAIAASMGSGTNAALGYGVKFPAALQGMFLAAVGITALPYFATLLAQKRAAYCLHSLNKLTGWLLTAGLLIAIPLGVYSTEIVALLYHRGAFDAAAIHRVAPIQVAYFAQLPFAIVAILGAKTLVALGRGGLISGCTIVGVLCQCVLAYALGLHHGAQGIAWAAALISVLLAVTYFLLARSTLRRLAL